MGSLSIDEALTMGRRGISDPRFEILSAKYSIIPKIVNLKIWKGTDRDGPKFPQNLLESVEDRMKVKVPSRMKIFVR
jgi:hypothetical protein